MGIFDILSAFLDDDDDDFDENDYLDDDDDDSGFASDLFDIIGELIQRIWNAIKKIFVRIINFTKNILSFFQDPARLRQLQADKNKLAVSIKEKLEDGNYAVVNCLYDKKADIIEDIQEDAIGIVGEEVDARTKKMFGKKDMIVLQ